MEQKGINLDPEMVERLTGTLIGALGDALGNVRMEVETDGPDEGDMFIDASTVDGGLINITLGDLRSCHSVILTPDEAIELVEVIEGALDGLPCEVDGECCCGEDDGPDAVIVAAVRHRD